MYIYIPVSGIQRSLYSAVFGCDAKVGLKKILPEEILERIQTEDILLTAFTASNSIPEDHSTERNLSLNRNLKHTSVMWNNP